MIYRNRTLDFLRCCGTIKEDAEKGTGEGSLIENTVEVKEMKHKHISFCLFVLSALFAPTVLLILSLNSLDSTTFGILCFLLPAVVFTAIVLLGACVREMFSVYTSSHPALSKAESSFISLSALTYIPTDRLQKKKIQSVLKNVRL